MDIILPYLDILTIQSENKMPGFQFFCHTVHQDLYENFKKVT